MPRLSRSAFGAALVAALAIPTVRAAEPDKLIPSDAEFVVYVNVQQVLESDIIKKFALEQMKQALQGNDAQKMIKELGLDPLKDINTLVIAGSGKDQTDMKFVAIVHGKFEPEKLYKAAEAQSRKDADHFSLLKEGKDVVFKYQPDNGNPVYGTVVDQNTIVLGGDKKTVTTALATATGSKGPAINKDLSALVGKMDNKASLWLASVVKGRLNDVKIPAGAGNPNLQKQLGDLETFSAVVRVEKDINLEVILGMKDAGAATEFGKSVDDLLTQAKGLVPFLTAQNPQLKPLVEVSKSLKSTVKNNGVIVTAKMTGAAIGALANPGGE